MDCAAVRSHLHAWIDDEVSPAEATSIGAHIERCSECHEAAERIRSTKAVVKRHAGAPAPDPEFAEEVRRSILEEAEYGDDAEEPRSTVGVPAVAPGGLTRRALIAAGAVAVISGVVGVGLSSSRVADAQALVIEDCLDLHARMISDMDEPRISCSDPERAGRAARERLRLSSSPATLLQMFELSGYTPVTIEVEGRRMDGVEFFCKRDGRPTTIVIYALVPQSMELEAFHFDQRGDFTIVTWADSECVMAIASALPRSELEILLQR